MIEFSLWSLPDFISIIIGVTIAIFFLILKSDNRKANIFLSLFLLSISLEIFSVLLEDILIAKQVFNIDFQTSLFTIPFLYFYVKNCINQKQTRLDLLFLLPGIIVNVLIQFKIDFQGVYLFRFIEYVFNIIILWMIYKKLKNHRTVLVNYYTELEQKTLSWIKTILYIFIGFHILWIFEDVIGLESEFVADIFPLLSTLLTLFTIFVVAYHGFSQPEIFKKRQFNSFTNNNETRDFDEGNIKIFEEVKARIINDKLYLIQDLNLSMLAAKLEIKDKDLSGIINRQSGTSFYHFINNFRLIEFKELLNSEKESQLSLLGLAQEAGFKSKSTFYDFFKKVEGITPNQYKKEIQK
ncbi:MAG: AraC family transcriptional regulator [Bacteroidales bacterium]|nr:AraC family transcriptional regulator [Bacteroidales bacterium]